ncbi:MAG TPA: aminoacetone oxidase family FAD-binding enzyme, partial [Puia sp.]|nr:aminoacetone oxidase family FAD-binding enzyme [Puia sp.]
MRQLIVIGGGAAGIFCAVNAARKDPVLRVTVLEKTGKLLSKVRVSGGGRCNVTHAAADIGEMARKYPRGGHFVRKAFHRWFTADTIEWYRDRGVELKTEEDGRMFPVTDSSQTIIDCLMREVNRLGVEILMQATVEEVRKIAAAGASGDAVDSGGAGTGEVRFEVRLAGGRVLSADFVCIACGGYPKSAMFDWIEKLGHTIESPVPSLFTFNIPGHPINKLMGISVAAVQIKIAGSKLVDKGPLLITHWGLSGPVILRLSAWGARELAGKEYNFMAQVNWLAGASEQAVRERLQEIRYDWAAQKIGSKNPWGLPQRLW